MSRTSSAGSSSESPGSTRSSWALRAAALRVIRLGLRPRHLLAVRLAARKPEGAFQHDQPPTLLGDHVEPGIAILAPLGTAGVGAPGRPSSRPSPLRRPLHCSTFSPAGTARSGGSQPCRHFSVRVAGRAEADHDFHPETLYPVLLVGGCVLLARERIVWFLVTAAVAFAMKETWGPRTPRSDWCSPGPDDGGSGAGLAVAGAAWSALAVFVVLPTFGNAAESELPRFAGVRATRSRRRSSSWCGTR